MARASSPQTILCKEEEEEKDIIMFDSYEKFMKQKAGARVLLKHVDMPQRFGVAEISDSEVLGIEEKPANPKSSYAVTGIYFYDSAVFEIIRTLKPSARGELEVTDINNAYIARGQLGYDILEGWWTDAGTFQSLEKANQLIAKESVE